MANQKHLDILKKSVETWNMWREEHPNIRPDLSDANLYGVLLYNADLSNADLSNADLNGADLSNADLNGADLSCTNLGGAVLHNADLSSAELSSAELSGADLSGATLHNADLNGANVGYTSFGDVDLSAVKNLETVCHSGPSTIGIDTIYRSHGNIDEAFLRGAGVDDTFITYIHSLIGKPIEYYSCFISYSSQEDVFARRLYADLQSNNVRCWFAPEDLKWGERIRTGIDEAIRMHDKLLLILSKHSVASGWVEREVKTALTKEHKEKRTVLFPVRVDNSVFECPFDWATEIRHERNIGDFTHWKDHDAYQKAFTRLLRDLKSEAIAG
jgi:TIR domain-containing protein/pentapeptide repeat protein